MRRSGERLTLTVEHRAAAGVAGIPLTLTDRGEGPALELSEPSEDPPAIDARPTTEMRIERALAGTPNPLTLSALRQASGLRTATLCDALKAMLDAGRVARNGNGYALTAN